MAEIETELKEIGRTIENAFKREVELMAVTEEQKKIFERMQMEKARKKFLANPYKGTEIEVIHGKEKEWIQEESMKNMQK